MLIPKGGEEKREKGRGEEKRKGEEERRDHAKGEHRFKRSHIRRRGSTYNFFLYI